MSSAWPASLHRRSGHTTTVTVGETRLSFTANRAPDGSLDEVLIRWGRHGSATAGMIDAYAAGLTLGLHQGVPLTDLLHPALGASFAPSGPTSDPEIPRARSVIDYLARRLAIDWLPYQERAGLGVFTASERGTDARLTGDQDEPGAGTTGSLPPPA
jgi:ribonucleoside-diphosphate reductase alpha chain